MIAGKNVLWCFNVYDRSVDLRFNITLLRKTLGHDVDILTFCNCRRGHDADFRNVGEDHFIWAENTGHHLGTLDSYVGFRDFLKTDAGRKYDIVVVAHAKSWWTDYTLLRPLVHEFVRGGSLLSHIHLRPHGAMNDPNWMGFWLDFLMYERETYVECIGRMAYDGDIWSEVLMYRAAEFIPVNRRLVIEQCDVPIGTRSDVPPFEKTFDNFITSGHAILASYSIPKKLSQLFTHNPTLAQEMRPSLPQDVETWDWTRRS